MFDRKCMIEGKFVIDVMQYVVSIRRLERGRLGYLH